MPVYIFILFFLVLAVPILTYIILGVKRWNRLSSQFPGNEHFNGIEVHDVLIRLGDISPPVNKGGAPIVVAYNMEGIYLKQPGGIMAEFCNPIFISGIKFEATKFIHGPIRTKEN